MIGLDHKKKILTESQKQAFEKSHIERKARIDKKIDEIDNDAELDGK